MKLLLHILAITVLLDTACTHPKAARQQSLRYHNRQCGFTFLLPADWKGYSVAIQEWRNETYPSPDAANTVVTDRGPMIVFRHPDWRAEARYQDIPILVFTLRQWDDLHHGKLWPSLYAGGVMVELWHNRNYVFGISTRFDADDSVNGWKEAGAIVARNCAANEMERLYEQ